jgi:hypothetical protein
MCRVFQHFFSVCGCLDANDWRPCGQNCTGTNIQWLRGADTSGKCPECAYPTPDSMQIRSFGVPTLTNGESRAGQGQYADDSQSDMESTATMLGECEDVPHFGEIPAS